MGPTTLTFVDAMEENSRAIADYHLPKQPRASAAGDLPASKSGIHSLASSSRSRRNYYSGSACCLLGCHDVITEHSSNDGIRIHSQIARKDFVRETDWKHF